MSALGAVVRAGVGRRRVQTMVMTLTAMLAVTASVLSAGLLAASQAPFDHAFARQQGAHLTAQFNGATVTAARLSATAHARGVTGAAGPFPLVSLRPDPGSGSPGLSPAFQLPQLTLVGRANQGGPVDKLDLIAGRWATGNGEIVAQVSAHSKFFNLGDRLHFAERPGHPTLTVVGLATSVAESADGWVTPAQVAALTAPGAKPDYQMSYRFAQAATAAQVATDRAEIAAAVPPEAMTGAASYLKVKLAADRASATFVPFVVAFAVLGLFMSVLVISIVVSGAVTAGGRRIGILKALGFTPAQVVRAYLGQALIPATVGTGLGVILANLLAIPIMSTAESGYDTSTLTVPAWVDVAVPALALAVVAASALLPALRAGRLSTTRALAVGRVPADGRGRVVRRLLSSLPLPRPVSLGLANPFARPGRSTTMAMAVAFGTIGVTFGVGLALSLGGIQSGVNRHSPGAVVVQGSGGNAPPAAPAPGTTAVPSGTTQQTSIAAAIRAQPGTRRFLSTTESRLGVSGLSGATTVIAYQGDSSWASYQMIAGSWFSGPGQADVPSGFLTSTGTHIGDTIRLTDHGRSVPVRIVGEVLAVREEGMLVLTDSSSLLGLGVKPDPVSLEFGIDLKQGTDRQSYLDSLNAALQPLGVSADLNGYQLSGTVAAMDSLAAMLTVMVVAVAGLGVLNTVVLDTRERVHDFGVFKALGMSPRQTVTMILTSVAGLGLLAGALGVPIGIALHDLVLPAMGRAAGTKIPVVDVAVYQPLVLAPLVLGGLLIAVVGAMMPAGWAAKTRTATALRTE